MSKEFIPAPKRPYLLRAFYEWILDNNLTPHLLVDARSDQVLVPREYVKNGNIVLNVSPVAANGLMMENDQVTFSARFNGRAFSIWLPMWAIMAIYSRETQDGISFPPDEYPETSQSGLLDQVTDKPAAGPALSLATVGGENVEEPEEKRGEPADKSGESEPDGSDDDDPPPASSSKSSGKRPALRVVK